MKRTQVYLDEEAWAEIEALAREAGRSAASVVRDAVTDYLGRQRAEEGRDPILSLIEWGKQNSAASAPVDAAEEHDHYLYGAPKER